MSIAAFLIGVVNLINSDRFSLTIAKFWFPIAVVNEITAPVLEFKPAQLVFFFACSLLWLMLTTGYIKPKKG